MPKSCCKHITRKRKATGAKGSKGGFIHNNAPEQFHARGPKPPSSDSEMSDGEEDDLEFLRRGTLKEMNRSNGRAHGTGTRTGKNLKRSRGGGDEDKENVDDDEDEVTICAEELSMKKDLLITRLKIYNNLLKFNKAIKEDQVFLYKKLQDMDELYLRNTAAILRLGFCSCLVHRKTSPVGDKLIKIHKRLRNWDAGIEEMCDFVQEPSSRKTTKAILQILNISEEQIGSVGSSFNDVTLPEIVWDLNNSFIEKFDVVYLAKKWKEVRAQICERIGIAENKFQEVCWEFGVTRLPAPTPTSVIPNVHSYDNAGVEEDEDEDTEWIRVPPGGYIFAEDADDSDEAEIPYEDYLEYRRQQMQKQSSEPGVKKTVDGSHLNNQTSHLKSAKTAATLL